MEGSELELLGTVTVVNKRWVQTSGVAREVYIGRPGILGNPFKLGPFEKRGATLARYESYLRGECRSEGLVYNEIIELAREVAEGYNLNLVCYCAPLPCHGDLLARDILGYAKKTGHGVRVKRTEPAL